MAQDKAFVIRLAHEIASKTDFEHIEIACTKLFLAIVAHNAAILMGETNNSEVEEAIHLLRSELGEAGLGKVFEDEELCTIAHAVAKIKLDRA